MEAVIIDGSEGEGGGQVLRSSLSLSMITGRPFKIKNIRSGRKKPGLMRQHLTCVKAAAEICNAKTNGAELGSQELFFIPSEVKSGEYHFPIGTAGSTSLVAQTVIPALMLGDTPSKVLLEGGTHNVHAPTFDFLQHSFLPILKKMGIEIKASLHSHGFYPAGGGKVEFEIQPVKKLKPIEMVKRGKKKSLSAEALFANLSVDIPQRELKVVGNVMGWSEESLHIRQIKKSASSGNVVFLKLEHENVTETVVSFGRLGVKSEKVAQQACDEANDYLASKAAVGVHLADQLLLPMALAGEGKFTMLAPSQHTKTNIGVIKKFVPCNIALEQVSDALWQINITN
ncbi:MAG: RNA 3'-terminal phosphate cyclase [Hyphomicrobiaceae bacterium]|nr:RNA 3'-terminal phosphate cyclase [Hyphomicrobiaceae bacterium]